VGRRRAVLAVLALAVSSLLIAGFAGSAAAGGPTSVLLVAPGEGRTASLYSSSSDYAELARLVDAFNTQPGSTTTPPSSASGDGASGTLDSFGPEVTVTWLIHDVQVWRVDRVYLDADDGPWISTQMALDGGDIWAKPPTWHTAGEAKRLVTLLDRLGVGSTTVGQGTTGRASSSAGVAAGTGGGGTRRALDGQPTKAFPTAAEVGGTGGLPGPAGWGWGLVGVVLGVVLTLAAWRLVAVVGVTSRRSTTSWWRNRG
jgi:hypothetical protein